jgi:8-oxo-dGTP diphosphatase
LVVTIRAAGGLITRRGRDGGIELLVVHRPKYDDWSLPKGKLDEGETDEEAALREVEEETGYRCTLGEELPTVEYLDRDGRQKRVRYWRMQIVAEGPWSPNKEIDDRRWIPIDEADTLLTYAADRGLVERYSRSAR